MIDAELRKKIKEAYKAEYKNKAERKRPWQQIVLPVLSIVFVICLPVALSVLGIISLILTPVLVLAGFVAPILVLHKDNKKIKKIISGEMDRDIDVLKDRYMKEFIPQRLTEKTKAIKNAHHEFNKVQKALRDEKKILIADGQTLQKAMQINKTEIKIQNSTSNLKGEKR